MALIKDNHIRISGGIRRLPDIGRSGPVEIEVGNLRDFRDALKRRPDVIMLDNMNIGGIQKAVRLKNKHDLKMGYPTVLLEVSGKIRLEQIKKIVRAGIDLISVGSLTHSVRSVDISLEVVAWHINDMKIPNQKFQIQNKSKTKNPKIH